MLRGFARRENRAAWWLPGSRGDTTKVVVGLAYPTGDVALLGVLVAGVEPIGWRPDGAWLLIGTGLLLFVVADSI
jgi:hypothetical protein